MRANIQLNNPAERLASVAREPDVITPGAEAVVEKFEQKLVVVADEHSDVMIRHVLLHSGKY